MHFPNINNGDLHSVLSTCRAERQPEKKGALLCRPAGLRALVRTRAPRRWQVHLSCLPGWHVSLPGQVARGNSGRDFTGEGKGSLGRSLMIREHKQQRGRCLFVERLLCAKSP